MKPRSLVIVGVHAARYITLPAQKPFTMLMSPNKRKIRVMTDWLGFLRTFSRANSLLAWELISCSTSRYLSSSSFKISCRGVSSLGVMLKPTWNKSSNTEPSNSYKFTGSQIKNTICFQAFFLFNLTMHIVLMENIQERIKLLSALEIPFIKLFYVSGIFS